MRGKFAGNCRCNKALLQSIGFALQMQRLQSRDLAGWLDELPPNLEKGPAKGILWSQPCLSKNWPATCYNMILNESTL
jgi:hypothetical protein